jgi:hypothetical protein
MLSPQELQNLNITSWENISQDFANSDLLLGNGFSIALDNRFAYGSIYDCFLENLEITNRNLFTQLRDEFQTTNFETLLHSLKASYRINRTLNLSTTEIQEAGNHLKNGLISTIQEIHPRSNQVNWERLSEISRKLDVFNDIYTCNYDAFLYHIIMLSLDRFRGGALNYPFQDYYWENVGHGWLKFMGFQNYEHYRHVYYMHGALFLFKFFGENYKIRRGVQELVDIITQQIENSNFPLFVAEGSGRDKMERINSDRYLRFCYDSLAKSSEPLVTYGISLGDSDSHILEAIKKTPRNLAIGIYTGTRSEIEIRGDRLQFETKFNGYPRRVSFFSAQSLM